jgi:hypothetical protein
MYGTNIDKVLLGKIVEKIYFNKENLQFLTDSGIHSYQVDGDCCSHSEFWDFYGVKTLIGSRVISVESVELDPATGSRRPDGDDESTEYYGYKVVSENTEFGEVTAVFSFRNISNGYYGGSLQDSDSNEVKAPEITEDVLEAANT